MSSHAQDKSSAVLLCWCSVMDHEGIGNRKSADAASFGELRLVPLPVVRSGFMSEVFKVKRYDCMYSDQVMKKSACCG